MVAEVVVAEVVVAEVAERVVAEVERAVAEVERVVAEVERVVAEVAEVERVALRVFSQRPGAAGVSTAVPLGQDARMADFEIELHHHVDLVRIYRRATEQERAEIERLRDSTPGDQRGVYTTEDGCDRYWIRAIPQLANPPVVMVGTDIHVDGQVPQGMRESLDAWLRSRSSVFRLLDGRLVK